MEEEKAANKDFDDKAISSVKVAMMGPLAGIGDSLLSNTWRILVTGLVASMALAGNLAAPIIFVVLLNIPHLLCRYYGLKLGYGLGVKFFSRVADSGIMEKVTWACSVVGIMVIGAMVSSIVYMSTPIIIGSGGEEGAVVLQEILDSILPSLMPLGLTGLLYWLLKKKVNVIVLVIGIMVLGIALSALGILA